MRAPDLDQGRDFAPARQAPGRPEIDDQNLPVPVAEPLRLAVEAGQRDRVQFDRGRRIRRRRAQARLEPQVQPDAGEQRRQRDRAGHQRGGFH